MNDDDDVLETLPDSRSYSGEGTGHVDRWLQQNALSASSRSADGDGKVSQDLDLKNKDDFKRHPSSTENSLTRTSNHKEHKRNISNARVRKISVSSSEEELEISPKKKHTSETLKQPSSSYSKPKDKTSMKRSCSPISVSDSDDDEELLTLTLKQRIQGHASLPQNEPSQSTMASMDWDSQTVDSSTQQTGETYSSVETSSACSMTQDSQDPAGKKKRKRTPEEIEAAKRQALVRY